MLCQRPVIRTQPYSRCSVTYGRGAGTSRSLFRLEPGSFPWARGPSTRSRLGPLALHVPRIWNRSINGCENSVKRKTRDMVNNFVLPSICSGPFSAQLPELQHFLHSFSSRYTTCIQLMVKRTFLVLIFLGLLSSQLLAQEKASAQPPAPAAVELAHGEKLRFEGIHNAGKINDVLYRGAQPQGNGLAELKKLGITTIVDLRGEDREKYEWEGKETESLGMRFVHLPVSGWAPPSDAQVAQFLALFRDDPHQKVFVHCRFGDDRTGVFVATYRMAVNKWSSEKAMDEMYFFGFNGFWHPAMKKFIREFPNHLRTSPAFAPIP